MDRVPQEVLRWLHGVLQTGYRDVNAAYYDVANALGQFPQLRTNTEEYVFENGRPALLVRLYGSIPAAYRGTTYAYPVTIWIPHEYPAWPPISYVNASQGLSVRPNQHISADGKIYHPYFGEGWQPGRSNIAGILNALVEIFSREPPLVARSNAPPVPPIPGAPGRSESLRSGNAATPRPNNAPALPPKPGQDRPQSVASPSAGLQGPPPRPPKSGETPYGPGSGYQSSFQSRPLSVAGPPQLPPQQPLSPQSPQGYQQGPPPQQNWQQFTQDQRQSGQWQQGGMPQDYRATPPISQQQQPARQALQPGYPPPQAQYGQSYQQRPPGTTQPNMNQPSQQWQNQQYPPQQNQQQQQKRAPAQPPEDLLTSPFDVPLPTHLSQSNLPVPPVPPNPEKDALLNALTQALSTQLNSTLTSTTAALAPLRAQNIALSSALNALQHEHAHLRALEAQVQANESTLHSSLKEADRAIADAKQRPVPDIDETLIPPRVLDNQLYNLVAEEKSCVAAREVLGKGLDRGRLGAEQWVRSMRGVAREEWLKKWLVRRAAVGMGLQGVSWGKGGDDEKEVVSEVGEDEDGRFYYTG